MKAKKIFKVILAVGTLAGVGFGAYKFGEFVGKDKEKKKHTSDDDFDFYTFDDRESDDFWVEVCDTYKEVCDNYSAMYDKLVEERDKLREELEKSMIKENENNE